MGIYTIKKIDYDKQNAPVLYYLDFPNKELKTDFPDDLYKNYFGIDRSKTTNHGKDFLKLLKLGKFDQTIKPLNNLYAQIPHDWYKHITISNYEAWYASCLLFTLLGNDCNIKAEQPTPMGRSYFVLEDKGYVFVFEVKVIEGNKKNQKNQQAEINKTVKLAFEQIQEKGYLTKYSSMRNKIYSVVVVMSKEKKNIVKIKFKQHIQKT